MASGNSGESGSDRNYTEAVGTRLTPRTKRAFDEFKDERELGNAQAMRRLIRRGLDVERGEIDPELPRPVLAGIGANLLGLAVIALPFAIDAITPDTFTSELGSVLIITGILLSFLSSLIFAAYLLYRQV